MNQSDEISSIKQGFLCPECKNDYRNIDELENHFNSLHLNERDERSTKGNQLNKFIDKAKKILKTDSKNLDDSFTTTNSDRQSIVIDEQASINLRVPKYSESECYFSLRKDQTIGLSRNHFNKNFKKIRNSKIERDVQETNKLLIRIDQLIQDLPTGKVFLKLYLKLILNKSNNRPNF